MVSYVLNVKFKKPIRYPSGIFEGAVGNNSLDLGEETWAEIF